MNFLRIILLSLMLMAGWVKASGQGEDLLQKGTDLYYSGDYPKSLLYLDSAIALNTSDISRLFFRSKVKLKAGDVDGAISDLTLCIYQSDSDENYLMIRGGLYEQSKELVLAHRDYSSVIDVKPGWEAYFRRGYVLAKQKQFKKALQDLNQSIALNDSKLEVYKTRALVRFELEDATGACDDMAKVYNAGYEEARDWLRKNCK